MTPPILKKTLKWFAVLAGILGLQIFTYYFIGLPRRVYLTLPENSYYLLFDADSVHADGSVYNGENCTFETSRWVAFDLKKVESKIKKKFDAKYVCYNDTASPHCNTTLGRNLHYAARCVEYDIFTPFTTEIVEEFDPYNSPNQHRRSSYTWVLFFWYKTSESTHTSEREYLSYPGKDDYDPRLDVLTAALNNIPVQDSNYILLQNPCVRVTLSESSFHHYLDELNGKIDSSSLRELVKNSTGEMVIKLPLENTSFEFNKNVRLIPPSTIDSMQRNINTEAPLQKRTFYVFSTPIFDDDMEFAVVTFGGGQKRLAMQGRKYLFKKVNKEWVFVATFDPWTS